MLTMRTYIFPYQAESSRQAIEFGDIEAALERRCWNDFGIALLLCAPPAGCAPLLPLSAEPSAGWP